VNDELERIWKELVNQFTVLAFSSKDQGKTEDITVRVFAEIQSSVFHIVIGV
jgi:hypothetical protein